MSSPINMYPTYLNKVDNSTFCKLHNNNLCVFICSESLCPKSGFICKTCLQLDIHKPHTPKIYTIQQALQYLTQNLNEDNFVIHHQEIRDLQEMFSDIITFFRENNVPLFLSLERILIEMKESFWNNLLLANTRNLAHKIKKIEDKDEEKMVINLASVLDSCSLPVSKLFQTDLKWYFDLAIQIIIKEFKEIIPPYNNFVNELGQESSVDDKKFRQNLLKRLSKV